MKVLVTGAAGFIGMHVSIALIRGGYDVVGIDNFNDYYDISLKRARVENIYRESDSVNNSHKKFRLVELNISDRNAIEALFLTEKFDRVVHLAAQAGVRYSIENPHAYIDSNIVGFTNILEGCRHHDIQHLVYASSSSVYGANESMPFSIRDNVDHPVSLYAATKKSNELMAHTYSHLYGFPTTGLRFFTVYGPWGRPDMSPFLFIRNMLADKPIKVFNYGNHRRDFTYIDDIVEGVVRVLKKPASIDASWSGLKPNPSTSSAPWRVYNIGNSKPVELMDFIGAFEKALDKQAEKEMLPMQPGDVPDTYADTSELVNDIGYSPKTNVDTGVQCFVDWYAQYYSIHR
ncbi:MAG: NAD-dependent epimerase [Cellvibrionaceae bacterium]